MTASQKRQIPDRFVALLEVSYSVEMLKTVGKTKIQKSFSVKSFFNVCLHCGRQLQEQAPYACSVSFPSEKSL